MKDTKGKKAVLVLASGLTRQQRPRSSHEADSGNRRNDFRRWVATIFIRADAGAAWGQARNSLICRRKPAENIAAMTEARGLPRFDGEIPSIMQDVAQVCATSTAWPTPLPIRSSMEIPQDQG